MRKEVLFAIIMLLFTLTLLPTAPIVAKPKPTEKANVTVSGDISTIDGVTLDISRAGSRVIVSGSADLVRDLVQNPNLVGEVWDEFETGHQLGIRIDKRNGKTCIIYTFGTSDFEGKEWARYRLIGSEMWFGDSIPYGTVTVTEKTFTIEEMSYVRRGKKGAIGVTYDTVWSDPLSFTITIGEV